jgi:hypothetical protein
MKIIKVFPDFTFDSRTIIEEPGINIQVVSISTLIRVKNSDGKWYTTPIIRNQRWHSGIDDIQNTQMSIKEFVRDCYLSVNLMKVSDVNDGEQLLRLDGCQLPEDTRLQRIL